MNPVVNLFFVVETILLQLCFDYSWSDKQPVATQIQQVYYIQLAKTLYLSFEKCYGILFQ